MNCDKGQLNIINESIDKNLLVTAAAGAGKTTVLTERIIKIILNEENDISLSDILVMTFTRKATAEMRSRIKAIIDERLKQEPNNKKLIKESATIQNANIMTIDSFCLRILEDNYTALDESNSLFYNFDPSYRVADEKEMAVLYDNLLDDFLESKYADIKYKPLFDTYVEKANEKRIRDILISGIDFLTSVTWPKEYLERQISLFEQNSKEAYNKYKTYILDDLERRKKEVSRLINGIDEFIAIYEETLNNKSPKENVKTNIEEQIVYFKSIKEVLEKYLDTNFVGSSDEIKKLFALNDEITKLDYKLNFAKVTSLYNCDTETNNRLKQDVKVAVEIMSELNRVKNIFSLDKEIILNNNEKLFFELLLEFYLLIVSEKKKRNLYEISDFSAIALDILYDKKTDKNGLALRYISERAKEIAKRYKLIFIDEYQDTNFLQEKILEALSDNYEKHNVFMVGDVKQSIYKFRKAEPKLFVDKQNYYKKNPDKGVLKTLNTNYRSDKEIICYINDLFGKTMTKDYGDIVYSDGNEFSVRPDDANRTFDSDKKVEIHVVRKYKAQTVETDSQAVNDELTKYTGIEHEADFVAHKIRDLVDSKKCGYKDIVILLRSAKNKSKVFADALSKLNIPAYADERAGLFKSTEINLMINILNVIDNPLQNIPLTAVLTSNIFRMSNDEIAFLKVIYDKRIDKSIAFMLQNSCEYVWKKLNSEKDDKAINDLLDEYGINKTLFKEKINNYFEKFEKLRFKARFVSISELIELIYEMLNIKDIVASMNNGKQRRANLDELYNIACRYENSSFVGLFNFLRYIERITELNKDEGQAKIFDENSNVVRIMTIHSAKGLEFNTVFLCGCGTNYNFDSSKDENLVMFSQDYGVGLNYFDTENKCEYPSPKKKLLSCISADDIRLEELRMLYVALTRAKKKLYIVGFAALTGNKTYLEKDLANFLSCKENGTNVNTNLRDCNNFLDVVLSYYPVGNEEFCSFDYYDWKIDEIVDNDLSMDVSLDIDKKIVGEKKIISNDSEYFKNLDEENIEKNLKNTYKYIDLQSLSPKFSVSSIKSKSKQNKKEQTKKINYYDPNEYEENDSERVGGTELGNAYHRFMQFYNYDKKIYDCVNEKNDKENCVKYIDNVRISSFLETNLGKRMAKAFSTNKLYREHKFMKLYSQDRIDKYIYGEENNNDIATDIYKANNIVVQGIVDAFFIENDGNEDYIVLVDYKTDGLSKKITDVSVFENILIDNYKIQLDIYADVLEELTGYKVKEKYIYSFALDKEIRL